MSRLLLLSLIVLSACRPPDPYWLPKDLARVEIFHVIELGQYYDITLDEASACYDKNINITSLCLRYTSEEIFDLCQSRHILVDLVDGLLQKINSDEVVSGQLAYPLQYDNLDLVITFDTFLGQYVDLQYVNQIRLQNGVTTYFAFSAFTQDDYFEKHSEPYEITQVNSYEYRRAKQLYSNDKDLIKWMPLAPPELAPPPRPELDGGFEVSEFSFVPPLEDEIKYPEPIVPPEELPFVTPRADLKYPVLNKDYKEPEVNASRFLNPR